MKPSRSTNRRKRKVTVHKPPEVIHQENWTDIAKNYAKEALDTKNNKRFGKWIRLSAERFLKDFDWAKKPGNPFQYSASEANKICDFISNLPHVEGTWKTEHITLEPFQVFFLCNLFGFRNLDGTRRFTSVLFAMSRKNAKSSLAAGIGLYCLTMENEKGPQVISAATTGDQAAIVFKIAKRMADKQSQLREAFNIECFTRAISCYDNGGLFKAINAKASTQDGLNPSCAILDEIHAHRTHDLLNVLQSAAGGRRNPLFLFTTTEGYETPGPWPEMRKFGQQVLEGVVEADHFLVIFYAIDDKDNEFDESIWEKANPLISVSEPLLKAIRKEATEAKSMPGRHAEFLIKRMNRQSSTANGWIDLQKWKACSGEVPLDELKNEPCYGALDLASTRDLASFRLVWKKDGIVYTHGWRWVPQTTIAIRTQRNLVPYAGWVRAGFMLETTGEVTDYDEIFKKVVWVKDNFNLVAVAFDQWNAAQIASKLTAEGVEMVQFIQGPKSYHPSMKNFEETYISGKFRHGGDPVLTWCASNIVLRTDANMNMAPDKKKSADKIDDMTALLMANGIMIGQSTEEEGNLDDFLSDPITIK
jgi:phage terminase large subunit-like protein